MSEKIEIILPEILSEDADDIHSRMLENAPEDINTIEGDIFWDTTRPTAETVAEMVHMKLIPALLQGFAQTAEGTFLDLHGDEFGAFRKNPNYSTGTVTFYGIPGVKVPRRTVVTTESTEDTDPIEFETMIDVVIGESKKATATIIAKNPGSESNVAAGTIKIIAADIMGLQKVTNEEETLNGTSIETDEAYRHRVILAKREKAESGNRRDYIKWALEVPGVGYAYAKPIWNGPGTVKVVILDEDFMPANETLLNTVQTYIGPKDNRNGDGQAPVGALVTVTTPTIKKINIAADITEETTANIEQIKKDIEERVSAYLGTLDVWDTVVFKAIEGIIASLILENKGVIDYQTLTINGQSENIELVEELAMIGTVTLT